MTRNVLATGMLSPGTDQVSPDRDRILIRDLVLSFHIGVHGHEKDAPQPVRVNIEIDLEKASRPIDDDIGNVVSYEGILRGIRSIAAGDHINLVETLAERIADLCLEHRRAWRALVRIEKLEVEPAAAGVGVEIVRHRRPRPNRPSDGLTRRRRVLPGAGP